jgi:hypothetical protein
MLLTTEPFPLGGVGVGVVAGGTGVVSYAIFVFCIGVAAIARLLNDRKARNRAAAI